MAQSENQIDQLERLAQLHERGLLTEAEFEAAKRQVLAGTQTPPVEAAPSRGILAWVGTGIAAMALVALLGVSATRLQGTSEVQSENTAVPEGEPEFTANEPEQMSPPQNLCGEQGTYVQLKNMIFEKANEVYGGDPVPLNNLRQAVSVRMELPVVSGLDDQVHRTDCSGRLVIDLPPGMRDAFDGEKSLQADLEYSFQPAADGKGGVIRAEGIGHMVQRLAAAAGVLTAHRMAAVGGPQLEKTYNPSFDCGRRLSNVERMICQDEGLSAADRALSDRYLSLKTVLPAADWKLVRAGQAAFLKQRSACADVACIEQAYAQQWQTLGESDLTGMDANITMDANQS